HLIPPHLAGYSRKPPAGCGGNKPAPAAVWNCGRGSLTAGGRATLMLQPYGLAPGSNGRAADTLPRPAAPPEEKPHPVDEPARRAGFEATFLPHLPAAYNLARWLTRDGHDAEDVVQEAYLRAFRSFGGFRGGDGRAWFLAIVRNTC